MMQQATLATEGRSCRNYSTLYDLRTIFGKSSLMDFRKKIFLAPLAGISETVFRALCKENGADVVMSEMVSAEGVFRGSKKTKSLLDFTLAERPVGIQIFGAQPDHIAYSASFIEEHHRPDFIDLNSGCPVPKVVKKNGGAALLRDAALFEKIVSRMVRAVKTPVTVKLRSSWSNQEYVDVLFAKIAQNCGASAVILHPRSKTSGFSGHSQWERIALVKSELSIPVIGNGNIETPGDAKAMIDQTGCDSIMIGRAALGNPWIFNRIRYFLSGIDAEEQAPTAAERLFTINRHVERYRQRYGDKKASADLKKHLSWYCKGLPCAAMLRNDIFRAGSMTELDAAITKAFTTNGGE
jgi:tRNA-dihydrouridine synthase B